MTKHSERARPAAAAGLAGNRRMLLGLYLAAVFLFWMAQYLYMPTLPLYVKANTRNLAMVGVVLAMYGLWQTLVRIPLGMAADWLGWRRPLLAAGVGLAGVGAWTLGIADNALMLLIGRAITGVAAGTWVLLVVGFNSSFTASEMVRATSIITLAGSGGRVLATSLTGLLNNRGGYSLAFFCATAIAGLAVLIVLVIPEQRSTPQPPSFRKIHTLLSNRAVLFPSVLSAISQHAFWASSYGFIPIMARELGATDVMQSVLISSNIAMIVLGNMIAAGLGKRLGNLRMIALSVLLMAAGVGAAAGAGSLALIAAAQVCTGLSWGLGYPVYMGASMTTVDVTERATAMGMHQAIYGIGMFSGPWLSGLLADQIGIRLTLAITAGLYLGIGLAGVAVLRKTLHC